ncbi:LacI family DNA-binding transcriptional regulator [Pelagibacterium sp.]|uniref:LacI family DNA-binding transcriptional regulator n=1 Tax=Pelagibacterium sp. TaxID=1967288 RepID=UPI003BAA2A63
MSDTARPPLRKARTAPTRATIRTVAEDAGVSVSAVSKVLRNAYGVSDALRSKVNASIDKLNYRPSASARGMRGRSYTLGVLLSDIRNPFFSEIMAGINEALSQTPYQPLLGVSDSAVGLELALVESMVDRQMDGLIFVAPRMALTDIDAAASRTPTAVIGIHSPGDTLFDTINGNDELGAEQAIDYLVGQGRQRIVHISLDLSPEEDSSVTAHREIGYHRAMERHGLSAFAKVYYAEHSPLARDVARRILEASDRPEAIFCWTDACAFEVISAALELGLSIPGDVAVFGYDNSPLCDLAQNNLTSVDQSGRQLGMEAARLVMERIEGRQEARHVRLETKVIARQSTG